MAKYRDAQTDEICHCKTAITIRHAISPELPSRFLLIMLILEIIGGLLAIIPA